MPRSVIPLTICLLTFIGIALSPAADDKPGVEIIENSIGMKLVKIPAGRFSMGSSNSEAEREAEEAAHEVAITRPFYMGMFEVTQRQFARVMGDSKRAVFNSRRSGGPDHPMENALYDKVIDFCNKLSNQAAEVAAGRKYRLPTEAEWEYACRAGTTTAFYSGNSLSSKQANFNGKYPYGDARPGKYLRRTTPVGSFKPNAFGLYDMHGNVSEWCSDWYDPAYYKNSPPKNPPGPAQGVLPTGFDRFYLVIRGGSWLDDARACRSARRFRAMPRNRYRLIGFRVVCEVSDKPGTR